MKIANADKLKKHFESVVDVHLFTVPTIQTIINTFTIDIPDGDKAVFFHDEKGRPTCHNLSEEEREKDIFHYSEWVVDEKAKCSYCPACGKACFLPDTYCPKCGTKNIFGGPKP